MARRIHVRPDEKGIVKYTCPHGDAIEIDTVSPKVRRAEAGLTTTPTIALASANEDWWRDFAALNISKDFDVSKLDARAVTSKHAVLSVLIKADQSVGKEKLDELRQKLELDLKEKISLVNLSGLGGFPDT